MAWDFQTLQEKATQQMAQVDDAQALEAFRICYLGRKGLLAEIYAALAIANKDEKPALGKGANILRQHVTTLIEVKKKVLAAAPATSDKVDFDISLPGVAPTLGHAHVLTKMMEDICGIFEHMGFTVQEGPEMETVFHNFDALNIPKDHPSRDGFDTFYVDKKNPQDKEEYLLLRSQTSPGQIRTLQAHNPPLAVVIPGKVYRPDAVDASHSFMFHQIEGLLVDKEVKFSDLKGLLEVFLKKLFNEDIKMRMRPHFFPFTEPSAEVDIACYICKGKGCSVCGRNGWLEIMGCGMVHPKVFEAVGYAKGKYTGLAFGLGVERLAMLRYGIHDIRLFYENDHRFTTQF